MACIKVGIQKLSESASVRVASPLVSASLSAGKGVEVSFQKGEIKSALDTEHATLSASIICRPEIIVREVCFDDLLPDLPPVVEKYIYYGSSDTLPEELPAGKSIKCNGASHTYTSENDKKYVWVALPRDCELLKWTNTLDSSEDLVALGDIKEKSLGAYTIKYYYLRGGIGANYNITVR